jgi:hypothetical protein
VAQAAAQLDVLAVERIYLDVLDLGETTDGPGSSNLKSGR